KCFRSEPDWRLRSIRHRMNSPRRTGQSLTTSSACLKKGNSLMNPEVAPEIQFGQSGFHVLAEPRDRACEGLIDGGSIASETNSRPFLHRRRPRRPADSLERKSRSDGNPP